MKEDKTGMHFGARLIIFRNAKRLRDRMAKAEIIRWAALKKGRTRGCIVRFTRAMVPNRGSGFNIIYSSFNNSLSIASAPLTVVALILPSLSIIKARGILRTPYIEAGNDSHFLRSLT